MVFQSDGGAGKARKQVEVVLADLGLDPRANSIEGAGGGAAWKVARGSAVVMIAVNPGKGGAPARLRMVSPIVKMPFETPPAMLQRLLELNGTELPGLAFGMVGDEVVLVAERGVAGLDRAEVEEMLAAIGHYADEYDDLLVRDFGGTRVCDIG